MLLSITSMFISESLGKVIFFHPRQDDMTLSQSVEKLPMASFPEDVPAAILIPAAAAGGRGGRGGDSV